MVDEGENEMTMLQFHHLFAQMQQSYQAGLIDKRKEHGWSIYFSSRRSGFFNDLINVRHHHTYGGNGQCLIKYL